MRAIASPSMRRKFQGTNLIPRAAALFLEFGRAAAVSARRGVVVRFAGRVCRFSFRENGRGRREARRALLGLGTPTGNQSVSRAARDLRGARRRARARDDVERAAVGRGRTRRERRRRGRRAVRSRARPRWTNGGDARISRGLALMTRYCVRCVLSIYDSMSARLVYVYT